MSEEEILKPCKNRHALFELKPCPFCGATMDHLCVDRQLDITTISPGVANVGYDANFYKVVCLKCRACGGNCWGDTVDEAKLKAIEAWNRRAQ